MKITLRIPTEQYAYVEVELEEKGKVISPSEIREIHDGYMSAFKPTEGLTAKEMDSIIEKMCLNTSVEGGTEMWAKATQLQKDQINCLKRALSRIKSKQDKN